MIALVDKIGATVASYTYDAWGKCLAVLDANGNDITDASHIARINPFRYRGYYYDEETALYYLQSRYYDAEVGRFINADEAVYIGMYASSLSDDLFAYCENACVVGEDSFGYFFRNIISRIVRTIMTHIAVARAILLTKVVQTLRDQIRAKRTVTVISCSHEGWIPSSNTMGRNMAKAFGRRYTHTVVTAETLLNFKNAWANAGDCIVIHTHGAPDALADENTDEVQSTFAGISDIKAMKQNKAIRFVMMTACSTAGGDPYNNVAYHLSKKINPKGIVIANQYTVGGSDVSFGAYDSSHGWVAYKNGKIVRTPDQIPISITMENAYRIYRELTGLISYF